MDGPRVALFLFVIFFFVVSPNTQRATPNQHRELVKLVRTERAAVDLLNRTRYGDLDARKGRWLNVTGLRSEDGYAWDLLPEVQERARQQAEEVIRSSWAQAGLEAQSSHASAEMLDRLAALDLSGVVPASPFYRNVTGLVRGKWVRSSIGKKRLPPSLNLTALSQLSYTTKEYGRNITGHAGDLTLKLDEKESESVSLGTASAREIKAEMTIQDESASGDGWELTLHGVHAPESGSILLSTSSEKFAGIFALPHYARARRSFELVQHLLNRTLTTTIAQQEKSDSVPSYPWSSSPHNPSEIMFPTPHCEYIAYLQQHFLWPPPDRGLIQEKKDVNNYLDSLETELRYPTGGRFGYIPELKFSAVIFSPDCAFVLESEGPPDFVKARADHLKGPKSEIHFSRVRRVVELFSLVITGQIYLLIRQMKDASTPSTRSRVSYYTIAMIALGDGFVFLAFSFLSMTVDSVFFTLIPVAFLAFLCVSLFGMKFLMDIWNVQEPERTERERERERQREQRNAANSSRPRQDAPSSSLQSQATSQATSRAATPTASQAVSQETFRGASQADAPLPPPTVVITPAGADTLPPPVTASRPQDTGATPIIILPPDQDIEADAAENNAAGTQNPAQTTLGNARREMGAMYSKFYFLLMSVFFISFGATTWPTTIRSFYTNALAILYLSFWTPQIKRNIIRNCRKALRWEFVLGQSILRLVPFAYFYLIDENVLYAKPDPHMFYVLVGWLWLQIWILVSQEILGPRFFVPSGWAPPAYDYHPVLHEDDEEAGASMPIGFTQAVAGEDSPTAAQGESRERGKRTFDCAICMQNIEVPVIPAGGSEEAGAAGTLGAGIFGRRAYMVTPCRHIFHSPCLEGWMRYKLQCPICRDSLPPL